MLFTVLTLFLLKLNVLFGAVVWSPPLPLFENLQESGLHSVAVNARGEALMGRHNRKSNTIEFLSYNFTQNKVEPVILSSYPCLGEVSHLEVLLDNSRTVSVLWIDEGAATAQVAQFQVSPELVQEGEWSEPLVIENVGVMRNLKMRGDRRGNLLVLWEEFNGYDFQVRSTYFSKDVERWAPISTLSAIGFDCQSTDFAFDSQGNAIALWCTRSFFRRNELVGVQVVGFDATAQKWFGDLSFFETNFTLQNPRIDFDPYDQAHILWERKNLRSDTVFIQAIALDAALRPQGNLLDLSGHNASQAKLVSSPHNTYAFWKVSEASGDYLQSYCLTGSGQVMTITEPLHEITEYKMSTDKYGKLTVATASKEAITISQHEKAWETVTFGQQRGVSDIQLANDAMGNGLITWTKGGRSYYARGDYLLPPLNCSVRRVEKRYPAKKIICAVLSWTPSQHPDVVGYRVRRNDVVLCDVSTPRFIDKKCPRGNHVYTITTLNNKGLESQTAKVLFMR